MDRPEACPTCGRILFHMGFQKFRILAFAATFVFTAAAQVKPTLKPADYGKWETLGPGTLSPDGKWLAHEIRRTDKNDELRVSSAGGGKTQAVAFCSAAAFSADSHWLACEATVSEAEQDRLKKAQEAGAEQADRARTGDGYGDHGRRRSVVRLLAATPAFRRVPPVSADARRCRRTAARRTRRRSDGRGGVIRRSPVRNLATGVDTTFGNVTGFAWQENGTTLAMTIGRRRPRRQRDPGLRSARRVRCACSIAARPCLRL